MRTVNSFIRATILSKMKKGEYLQLSSLRITEWCSHFERLMRNRLVMGAIRFGPMSQKRKKGHTKMIIKYIEMKVNEYRLTGNTEMLVDIANLAMVEFVHSDHPCKHFKAIDRED